MFGRNLEDFLFRRVFEQGGRKKVVLGVEGFRLLVARGVRQGLASAGWARGLHCVEGR